MSTTMDFQPKLTEFALILENSGEKTLQSPDIRANLVKFYELVLQENEIQNLTRLLLPRDFYEGHVVDAVELEKSGFLREPAFDLGTGVGSPGLIHAILSGKRWILCDSEANKVTFLNRTLEAMRISGVEAVAQRAETYLNTHSVGSVTSKAVGTIEKLYGWLGSCSTWNEIILFKGPKWDEEWAEYLKSKHRRALQIEKTIEYRVGTDQKLRKLILLKRVAKKS